MMLKKRLTFTILLLCLLTISQQKDLKNEAATKVQDSDNKNVALSQGHQTNMENTNLKALNDTDPADAPKKLSEEEIKKQNEDLKAKEEQEKKKKQSLLIDAVLEAQKKIKKLKADAESEEKRKGIQKMADEIVENAITEPNEQLKNEQLSLASKLINHPFMSITEIKDQMTLRKKAEKYLADAKTEKDVAKRNELLDKAENVITELRTGRPVEISKIKVITHDMIKAASSEELQQLARDAGKILIAQSKAETDPVLKKKLVEEAQQIQNKPKENLDKYAEKEKIKLKIKNEINNLKAKLKDEKDPVEQKKLSDKIQTMKADPVKYYTDLKESHKLKLIEEAANLAKKLLMDVQNEKDMSITREKVRQAKDLENFPIRTLAKYKKDEAQKAYLTSVPEVCKKYIEEGFKASTDPIAAIKLAAEKAEQEKLKLQAKVATQTSLAQVSINSSGPSLAAKLAYEDFSGNLDLSEHFASWIENSLLKIEVKNVGGLKSKASRVN